MLRGPPREAQSKARRPQLVGDPKCTRHQWKEERGGSGDSAGAGTACLGAYALGRGSSANKGAEGTFTKYSTNNRPSLAHGIALHLQLLRGTLGKPDSNLRR